MTATPPEWFAKLATSIGIVRLFFAGGEYPNTSRNDSINIINNSYLPESLPAVLEESKNLEALGKEAGKVSSFEDIPLIVITGTSENRISEYPTRELGLKVQKLWMEMQSELLKLSTNSEQMFANKSGHYVQLQQPEIIVEAIKKLLRKVSDTSVTLNQ
jgi:hypothetical protein